MVEAFDGWIIAACQVDSRFDNSTWNTIKFLPNLCSDWETIVNGTLVQGDRIPDDTFSILMDTQCTGNQCVDTSISDTVCLTRISLPVHSFLEGEYYKTDVTGPLKNTPEYTRVDKIYYDGVEIQAYIWWLGEVDEDIYTPWWVISNVNLTTFIESNGSVGTIYAFCEAETNNPVDCDSGWRFGYGDTGAIYDNTFEMISGDCPVITTLEPREWPEYLCIGLVNETAPADSFVVPNNLFIGAYAINTTGTMLSDYKPHWTKPVNDLWPYFEVYIYYDAFWGWWQVGSALHVDLGVELFCWDAASPWECDGWVDWIGYQMNNIYLYECTEDDILSLTDNICLSDSSIMQDYLEGVYEPTGIVGDKYGTFEYAPTNVKTYDGDTINVYLWNYGEIGNDDDSQKWILSSLSYEEGVSSSFVPVYGYCQGSNANRDYSPQDCDSCWQFYYQGKYYEDCSFLISTNTDSDDCGDIDTNLDVIWHDHVCIRFEDDSDVKTNFDIDKIMGGYRLNETYLRLSGDKPIYYKPVNDYTNKIQYIWYDEFYNYWSIGPEIYVNATLQCQLQQFENTPQQCQTWYDSASNIIYNLRFYTTDCDENDVLTAGAAANDGGSDPTLIVLLVLLIVGICVLLFWWFKCKKPKDGNRALPQEPSSPDSALTTGGGTIEMDKAPFATDGNATGNLAATGGMDMSPLNPNEGNDTNLNDDEFEVEDEDVVPP